MVSPDFSGLSKKKPHKQLLQPLKKHSGRNVHGKITVHHRGGGSKRQYRLVDFKRDKDGIPAKVMSVEYDPNRSGRIALLSYADGEKRYILAPIGLAVGDEVISGENVEPKVGNCMPLRNIPPSLSVHNVELIQGRGGQIVRTAGSSAQLVAKEDKYAHLRLPSGEIRRVPLVCRATIGQVSNLSHSSEVFGKAGRKRWLGIRPTVRGMAMNHSVHPLGGGEGRSKGNRPPASRTGVLAKGGKTRDRRKASDKLIVRRRKK